MKQIYILVQDYNPRPHSEWLGAIREKTTEFYRSNRSEYQAIHFPELHMTGTKKDIYEGLLDNFTKLKNLIVITTDDEVVIRAARMAFLENVVDQVTILEYTGKDESNFYEWTEHKLSQSGGIPMIHMFQWSLEETNKVLTHPASYIKEIPSLKVSQLREGMEVMITKTYQSLNKGEVAQVHSWEEKEDLVEVNLIFGEVSIYGEGEKQNTPIISSIPIDYLQKYEEK